MPEQDPRCVKKNQKRNTNAGGALRPAAARPPRSCYVFDFFITNKRSCTKKRNQKRNTDAGGAQSPRGWARPPRSCYVFDFSFFITNKSSFKKEKLKA